MERMLSREADNPAWAMTWAVSGGQLKIVEYFIGLGTEDSDYNALHSAAHHGHIEIVKLMLARGEAQFSTRVMSRAARGGHLAIVELMLSRGDDTYDATMEQAARGRTPRNRGTHALSRSYELQECNASRSKRGTSCTD